MTTGLFIILLGAQAYLVKAYVLTPDASRFVAERFEDPNTLTANQAGFNSVPGGFNYQQAAYSQVSYQSAAPASQRSIAPPSWLCWPILFFGVVIFLHGIALR